MAVQDNMSGPLWPVVEKKQDPVEHVHVSIRVYAPFIGNDYFCDTGSETDGGTDFYGDDPLWDGQGCGPNNECCTFNNPPWFCKQLPQTTSDDLELRICANQPTNNEDVPIEYIELYVQ